MQQVPRDRVHSSHKGSTYPPRILQLTLGTETDFPLSAKDYTTGVEKGACFHYVSTWDCASADLWFFPSFLEVTLFGRVVWSITWTDLLCFCRMSMLDGLLFS